jgi:hypothetical protein
VIASNLTANHDKIKLNKDARCHNRKIYCFSASLRDSQTNERVNRTDGKLNNLTFQSPTLS